MLKKLLPALALLFVTACAQPEANMSGMDCMCCKKCQCESCCCKDGSCDMCKGKMGKKGMQCPPKVKE